MLNRFNSRTWGSSIILKLDMTKAYDRLDWNFLKEILHSFGLGENFIQLIDYCGTTPKFSVMMNGPYKSFFKSSRGVRQGDPLTPYLFILAEELLTRMLKNAFENGKLGYMIQPVGETKVSHLA